MGKTGTKVKKGRKWVKKIHGRVSRGTMVHERGAIGKSLKYFKIKGI